MVRAQGLLHTPDGTHVGLEVAFDHADVSLKHSIGFVKIARGFQKLIFTAFPRKMQAALFVLRGEELALPFGGSHFQEFFFGQWKL